MQKSGTFYFIKLCLKKLTVFWTLGFILGPGTAGAVTSPCDAVGKLDPEDKYIQCLNLGTCYISTSASGRKCHDCPDGYQSDIGASSSSDCYKWQDSHGEDHVASVKCYYKDPMTCQTHDLTCESNFENCNFKCAEDYKPARKTSLISNTYYCAPDFEDCQKKVVHSTLCKKRNGKIFALECEEHYKPIKNGDAFTACNVDKLPCAAYLDEEVVTRCTDQIDSFSLGDYTVLGNVTGGDDSTVDTSQCLCKSDQTREHNHADCYRVLSYDAGKKTWTGEKFIDCACREPFCISGDGGVCDIPSRGYYYDTTDKAHCKPCPPGATSNFGRDEGKYKSMPDKGIKNCYIDKNTKFCDSHGCFSIDDLGIVYHSGN